MGVHKDDTTVAALLSLGADGEGGLCLDGLVDDDLRVLCQAVSQNSVVAGALLFGKEAIKDWRKAETAAETYRAIASHMLLARAHRRDHRVDMALNQERGVEVLYERLPEWARW